MRENFEAWMTNLKEWEGFKSNDSEDPGGETVYGIARTYHPNIPWPPTWEQAKAIYLQTYWVAQGCDELPFPLDVIHADASVNPGPGAAKGFLYDSGEHKEIDRRCVDYLAQRLRYYEKKVQETAGKKKFLLGWMDRTLDMLERTILAKWSMETLT